MLRQLSRVGDALESAGDGRSDAHSVFVLSIGVGSFDDGASVEDLGFVSSRMDEVQEAFGQLGATVTQELDPWTRFAQETDLPRLPEFRSNAVAASPDGRLLAAHELERKCLVLRAPTGRELVSIPMTPRVGLAALCFSPDSRILTAIDHDGAIHVFQTGSLPDPLGQAIPAGGSIGIPNFSMEFSPDSRLMALAVRENTGVYVIKVWDSVHLRLTARIPLPGYPSAFGFAGSDKIFVALQGAIAVYNCDGTKSEELPS